MAELDNERQEELEAITAIFPELVVNAEEAFVATIALPVSPATPLLLRFLARPDAPAGKTYADSVLHAGAPIEHHHHFSHLPPLQLRVTLPEHYPAERAPQAELHTSPAWLPSHKLRELESEVAKLWHEYGRCQIIFSYISCLQECAERGFDFDHSADACLTLPATLEQMLVDFDFRTKQTIFDASTFDCGICLDPKKGSSCYRLRRCGHVFCKACLQDFFHNAITEGDVGSVRCLAPDCGEDAGSLGNPLRRKRRKVRSLHPRELLAMGLGENMVRRYVEFKRKKRLEADKTTVYCPRNWCQGPARSAKYPPIPIDLSTYPDSDSEASDTERDRSSTSEASDTERNRSSTSNPGRPYNDNMPDAGLPVPGDRLAICEKCHLAFCCVCYTGWHGPFAPCWPRNPNDLSSEEKASYDYIRAHTSPCPTCSSPTQKTMGCNHMRCFQCATHFCYLCGAWLDGQNPYQHFNKGGSPCFQRLWELEGGDEGQGPGDGRGFMGARAWEQLAIDAAREADAQELAAAPDAAPALPRALDPPHAPHMAEEPLIDAMARVQFEHEDGPPLVVEPPPPPPPPQRRRPRNPFHQHPAQQNRGAAVRAHERAGAHANRDARRPGANARLEPVPNARDGDDALRRFVQLA